MTESRPFRINLPDRARTRLGKAALRPVEALLTKLLCLEQLSDVYFTTKARINEKGSAADDNLTELLTTLGVRYSVISGEIERIPRQGPVVVVSNHPFGALDAIILTHLLRSVRPDTRFFANHLLAKVQESHPYCIFVDPFGNDGSIRTNLGPLKEGIHWLKTGGALGIFPSGTVSHLHLKKLQVCDPPWSETIARIIRSTRATVVPVFFDGRNSALFQAAGLIHPLLRTALLPREFCRKCNADVTLRIGRPIPYEKLERYDNDADVTDYLRIRSYILEGSKIDPGENGESAAPPATATPKKQRREQPLAEPIDTSILRHEVESLPADQILIEHPTYTVAFAKARQIPRLLVEIGRLREMTFRKANEGTGRSLDLDQFDNLYTHLFVWNRSKSELVGAYRLVKTDEALRLYGKRGLYTHTLFAYRTSLIKQIGPALELGRSFIRPEYQRTFSALLLLWKGIGQFVVKFPRYKILFGTVSLSSDYDSVSRQLIMSFLNLNHYLPGLTKEVRARNPMKQNPLGGIDLSSSKVVRDLEDISDLLTELEATQKDMPVLLRKYLDLGAKLLGFNVDPNFSDVLDGLIYVDLTETEPRILRRYMGTEGADRFFGFHEALLTQPQTGT